MFSLSPVLTVSCLFDVFWKQLTDFQYGCDVSIDEKLLVISMHRNSFGIRMIGVRNLLFFCFFFRSGNAMTMLWHIYIDHHQIVTKWGLFRFLKECVMWVSVFPDMVSRNEIVVGFVVSFDCMLCRSLFVIFLLAIVLSVLLWLTDSIYPFGIFNSSEAKLQLTYIDIYIYIN